MSKCKFPLEELMEINIDSYSKKVIETNDYLKPLK
jgi:hypothetical protein